MSAPREFQPWRAILAPLKCPRTLILAVIFATLFLLTCLWFQANDVFNNHFSERGTVYRTYQFLKLASVVYLIWILYYVGHFILEIVRAHGCDFELEPLDRIIVSFYVGASAVAVVVHLLGYAHLYYRGVALAMTTPLVFASYPHLVVVAKNLRAYSSNKNIRFSTIYYSLLLMIVALLLLAILVDKAIVPTSEWDSLTHYIQYYKEVIHNHGTQPNNVWYHYYYSKGAGLVFLNMLLVDDTAASLPTFYMLVAMTAALFSISNKLTGSREMACATALIYLRLTMLDKEAVFEKQHLFMASLIIGVIFMLFMLETIPPGKRRMWPVLTALLLVHLIIFTPTATAFIAPALLICAGIYWVRNCSLWRSYAALAMVAAVTALIICGINYLVTGMFEINPFRLMWALADQRHFSQWMSPYIMVYLNEGSNPTMGTFTVGKTLSAESWFVILFHLDRFRFLFPNVFVLGAIVAAVVYSFKTQPAAKRTLSRVAPLAVLVVWAGIASLFFNQAVSMFRYFIFTTPLLCVLAICAWYLALLPVLKRKIVRSIIRITIAGAALYALTLDYDTLTRILAADGRELSFALGACDFQGAFLEQSGQWPELVRAKQLIGLDKRILSLNARRAIGAVPGRPVESEMNYCYRDWHQMVFAPPEAAKAAYIKEGLNYFVFDPTELFRGDLLYSPLFSPDTINDYFGVVYSEGSTYLLTWKKPGTEPLAPTITAALREIAISPDGLHGLYLRVRGYYEANKGAPYPVYSDPRLRPVTGWQ